MADILSFEAKRGQCRPQTRGQRKPPRPRLHADLRARAGLFAAGCSALLAVFGFGLALLVMGVLGYDGAFLGAAPGGLCVGSLSCSSPGAAHLGALSAGQREAIAASLVLLAAPALMILAHLRGLFRLYAAGIVFTVDNIVQISRIGLWLLAYSAAPFIVHRLLDAFGLFPDQPWFRPDQAAALVIGLSLLLVARIIDCGEELEQRRDLYI